MISGFSYFDLLPPEILQTGIFSYLEYEDLRKLRKLNNRRLKESVNDYIQITPGKTKNCILGHGNWFNDIELIYNMKKVIL